MKKKWIYIIAAAVIVVALAVSGIVYYYNANSYVAKVGNEKITNDEFRFFLGEVKFQLEYQLGITDWSSKVGNQTAEELAKEYALDLARDHKIELMQAKKNNIKLEKTDEETLDVFFDSVIQQQGSRVSAENMIKDQYGISWSKYKAIVRDIRLASKFRTAELEKINPTDDEVKAYYDENKESFDQVTVRHILISTVDESGNDLPEGKLKEAEEKANDILQKVNNGEDFDALAKEYSEDPGSKDNGGKYTFIKGQMVEEFEKWSFDEKRKAGDTGIVKSDYGYHVMKFEKREMVPFEDVKDDIISILKNESYTKMMDSWKQDSEFNIVKNEGEYNSIKIT